MKRMPKRTLLNQRLKNNPSMSLSEGIDTSIVILVVDDHSLTRAMVREILKGLGFENVIQAENGTNAVKKIFEEHVDLVICDWNMPTFSGLEVLRQVRADPRFRELPFLMLTAEAYRENVTEAVKAGVSDYMIKPFTAEILANKVQSVLMKNQKSVKS